MRNRSESFRRLQRALSEALETRRLLATDVVIDGTAGDDAFSVSRSGTQGRAFLNGSATPVATWDVATVGVVVVRGLTGNDALAVDFAAGDPLSTFGLRFEGSIGTDSLVISGSSSAEAATLSAGRVTFGGDPLNYLDLESLALNLGAGTDTVSAAGNASLTASAFALNVTAGKLRVSAGTTLPTVTALGVQAGATFDLAGVSVNIDALNGAGTILNDGAAATLGVGQAGGSGVFSGAVNNGTGTLSLIKRGEGRIELAGAGNFSGSTTIENGALRVSHSAALGSDAQGVSVSAGALTGVLEIAGNIGIADPVTLFAKNVPSGGTLLLPSVVNVSGNNVITSAVTGSFGGTGYHLRSDTGTLTFAGPFTRTDTSTYHRPFQLSGAGNGRIEGALDETSAVWGYAIQKVDTGTWLISQNRSLGSTRVDAGTLVTDKLANASTANGVTVTGGTLRVEAGTLPFEPTGSSLLSAAPTASSGQLDVTNNVIVIDYTTSSPLGALRSLASAGRIVSTTPGGFRAAVYEASERWGAALPTTLAGQTIDATSVVVQAALGGDANLDNAVNFDDLLLLAANYNSTAQPGTWARGDFNNDGTVNFDDLLILAASYNTSTPTAAAWLPVAQANFGAMSVFNFTDAELSVVQPLFWFNTLANAVVQSGPTRGFIDIDVWREPADNQPYNARVLENNVAFAYFYSTNRPWNSFYGNPQVRARLEATLEYWIGLQDSSTGMWPEYSATNYSLAPTSFGLRTMVRTLELLKQGPGIDSGVMRRTVDATLKGIRAMVQDNTLLNLGNDYSNQYTAVFAETLGFLDLYPEYSVELLADLRARVPSIASQHQSPAGFMYEAGGADWAYTLGTHQAQYTTGWHDIRGSEFQQGVIDELTDYYDFVNYNLVREPSGTGYVSNFGASSRTGGRFFTTLTVPMSEFIPQARYLNRTAAEEISASSSLRTSLNSNWGNWGTLSVPSSSSYTPGPFTDVDRVAWRPTDAQRSASINTLPYLASSRFNQQAVDSRRPLQFTFVRRPTYYASLNTGNVLTGQQRYGLGVMWNPTTGSVMQTQVNSDTLAWGTRASGATRVYEATTRTTSFSLNGSALTPQTGNRRLADGNLSGSYALGSAGTKSIAFDETGVTVTVSHTGAFSEDLPLLRKSGETVSVSGNTISLIRNGVTFSIQILTGGATASVSNTSTNIGGGLLLSRVTINASGALTYRMSFNGGGTASGIAGAVAPLSVAPPVEQGDQDDVDDVLA
jgi:autotransporter-associated beta strand protein